MHYAKKNSNTRTMHVMHVFCRVPDKMTMGDKLKDTERKKEVKR